jgi:hypothetical protein
VTASLGFLLPGCPLNDDYVLETAAVAGASGGGPVRPGPTAGEGPMGPAKCVPTAEICDGLSNDCDDEVDEDGVCPVGCTAKTYEGHAYLLCLPAAGDALDYADAVDQCTSYETEVGKFGAGLELVNIGSAEENTFVKDWLMSAVKMPGTVWIGANDSAHEGTWVWGRASDTDAFFTASPMGGGKVTMGHFSNFAPGRPDGTAMNDEDCGVIDSSLGFAWDDAVCSAVAAGFLCEEPN